MNQILLTNKFVLYPSNVEVEVTLSNTTLSIQRFKNNKSKGLETIEVDSIIGCHVLEGNKTTAAKWYIKIFSYPLKKNLFKKISRQRVTRSFGITSCYSNEDKKHLALQWKKVLKHLISGRKLAADQVKNLDELDPKTYIVYVNPMSGRAKAMEIFNNNVKTMFAEAEIQYEVVKTEYCGHAKDMACKLNLNQYDGIVLVSGDGLVHEVINGLMKRSDWKTAIKIPIGVVPGGSGNALAGAITYSSTRVHPLPSSLLSSIFEICRGNIVELDIMSTELSNTKNGDVSNIIYSFLGFIIGLIADIDIESERFRCLGQTFRTNLYAVMRIATLRKYKIAISYLPFQEHTVAHEADTPPEGRKEATKHTEKKKSCTNSNTIENNLLVPLSDPVPSTWKVHDGEFIQVTGLNISHVSEDVCVHSGLKLSDGRITLAMVKGSGNRGTILKLWDLMEKGEDLLEGEHFSTANCTAFRIDPHPQYSQIVTLDGEVIPFGSLQCQIHPGLARVFGRKLK